MQRSWECGAWSKKSFTSRTNVASIPPTRREPLHPRRRARSDNRGCWQEGAPASRSLHRVRVATPKPPEHFGDHLGAVASRVSRGMDERELALLGELARSE